MAMKIEILLTHTHISIIISAVDLLAAGEVQVIISPQTSELEARIIALICNRTHAPMLTFSSPPRIFSPSLNPYLFHATMDESSLAAPIASFIHLHGWRNIVLVYDESDFGTGILAAYTKALRQVNVVISHHVIIPTTATDEFIETELKKLPSIRVFIVHIMPILASHLFAKVSNFGMMDEGYVWIATDGISSVIETLDLDVLDSVQGLVGFRPYVPKSLTK